MRIASVHPPRRRDRKGAVLVEVAIIAPLALLVLLTLIVSTIAVFRLHQVNALANEGARWASAHGPKWAKLSHKSLPTADEVYQQAMSPLATSLPREAIQYDVRWKNDNTLVSVTLSYEWINGLFGLDFNLQGIAEMPVSN